ncbi:MAG: PorT family protein [Bacteroidetes bacterium]|nr:PorT family protein [Bacteroidota bacterium]
MKKLIIIATTLIISVSAFGQVKFGIKAGINASYFSQTTLSNNVSPSIMTGFSSGLHAGGYVNYSFNDLLAAQAEVLFSMQVGQILESQKIQNFDTWMGGGHTITSFNYINVPLLLNIKPFKFPLSFLVGPQFGYCVSRWDVDKLPVDESKYRNFDFAAACGVQYTFFNHLAVGLRYNIGLLPSYQINYEYKIETPDEDILRIGAVKGDRTNVLQLSIGWTF